MPKEIEQAVAQVLKPLGYTKTAATWHRDRGEVISVLNVQKSQWGDEHYVNLGVYLKALGDEKRPAESRCHVRCRANTPDTLGSSADPLAVAALVAEVGLPWLDLLSTERQIGEFLTSDGSRQCFVDQRARQLAARTSDAPAA